MRGPDRHRRRRLGPGAAARDGEAGRGAEAVLPRRHARRRRAARRRARGRACSSRRRPLLALLRGRSGRVGASADGDAPTLRSTGSCARCASCAESAERAAARPAGARSTISRRRSATRRPPSGRPGSRGRGRSRSRRRRSRSPTEVVAVTPIPYGELDAVARPDEADARAARSARRRRRRRSRGASSCSAAAKRAAEPAAVRDDGLVVLDLSASISTDTYAGSAPRSIELADTDGRYGLIVFSDTAYLALPPGTPAAELRPSRAASTFRADRRRARRADEPVDRLVQRRDEDLDRAAAGADTIQANGRADGRAPRQRPGRRRRRPRAPDQHGARVPAPRDPGPRGRAQRGARGPALHRSACSAARPISRRAALPGEDAARSAQDVRLALFLAALAAAVALGAAGAAA